MDASLRQKLTTDAVLKFILARGPVIPVQVVKEFGGNTMFAGAVLSQLVTEGKAKVSNTKIGGTPVYYSNGQESKLQELSKHLNEKDRKTFELLREKKIIRDNEQEPLTRVSLRNIKDFSYPLQVTIEGQNEIFWKWYLISDEEATGLIKNYLGIADKKEQEQEIIPEKIEIPQVQEEIPKELPVQKPVQQKIAAKKEERTESLSKFQKAEVQELCEFGQTALEFLEKKGISVLQSSTIKKNSEVDFIVNVPTPVGATEYYCKAKNKKKINESDISSAYVQGQIRRLPVILLSQGELTKKAREMASRDVKIMLVNLGGVL